MSNGLFKVVYVVGGEVLKVFSRHGTLDDAALACEDMQNMAMGGEFGTQLTVQGPDGELYTPEELDGSLGRNAMVLSDHVIECVEQSINRGGFIPYDEAVLISVALSVLQTQLEQNYKEVIEQHGGTELYEVLDRLHEFVGG